MDEAEREDRCVTLWTECRPDGWIADLSAHVDHCGNFRLEHRDFFRDAKGICEGSGGGMKISAQDLPALIASLGGRPGEHVLDILKRDWSGEQSLELEERLHASGIACEFYIYDT